MSFAANTNSTQVHFGISSPVSGVSWERFTPLFEPLKRGSRHPHRKSTGSVHKVYALALNNRCLKKIVFVNRNRTLLCITVCCVLLFKKIACRNAVVIRGVMFP